MYTLADLKSQDDHIRVCKAFVENQTRIIAERAALGMPTVRDERWLSVFVNGLARHTMRRAEIVADLAGPDDSSERPEDVDRPPSCIGDPRHPKADDHNDTAAA